jgi:hypothetical protein
MGMRDDAFPFLERAVLTCPVDPGFSLQLGLAEMERGQLAAAQRHVMVAKHLDPSDRRIDVALQDLALRRKAARKGKRAA